MNEQEIKDTVTNPPHYAGVTVEPIDVAQCYGFCIGNAIKYLYRAGRKDGATYEADMRKAKFYLDRWCKSRLESVDPEYPDSESYYEDGNVDLAPRIAVLSSGNLYLKALFRLDPSRRNFEDVTSIEREGVQAVIASIDDELELIEELNAEDEANA